MSEVYVPAPERKRISGAELFGAGIALSFIWGFGGFLAAILFFIFGKV